MDWTALVRKLLDDLMLSQSELARLCGVSQQSVSNWRSGKRKPELYAKRKLLQIFQENSMKLYSQEPAASEADAKPSRKENAAAISPPAEFIDIFDKMPASKQQELVEISRRKKAEEELKISQRNYRLLMESSDDIICTVTMPGLKILTASSALYKVTGIQAEAARALTLFNLVHPDDIKVIDVLENSIRKSSVPPPISCRLQAENKGFLWAELKCCPLKMFKGDKEVSEIVIIIKNISERKNAESEVTESEARFRLIAENSSDIISILSTDQIVLYVSPSCFQFSGFNSAQLIGRNHTEIIEEQDRKNVEKAIGKTLKSKTSCRCEYRIKKKNSQKTIWVESVYRYVKGFINDFNDVIISVSRDISKRKEVENALEYRENLLNASNRAAALLLSSSKMDAVGQTLTTMASALSADAASIFEFHYQGINGKTRITASRTAFWKKRISDIPVEKDKELPDFQSMLPRWLKYFKAKRLIRGTTSKFPPLEKAFFKRLEIKTLAALPVFSGKVLWGFIVFGKSSSEKKWIDAELKILKNYASTVSSYISRYKSQQTIFENEMKFRIIAENMPVMMWMADKDKNIIYANGKTHDFFGKNNAASMQASAWKGKVHPDDFERWDKTFSHAFKNHRKFKIEYRLRRNDGKFRWVIDFSSPLFGRNEKFAGFIGTCVDITERKLVEDMLSQSEQKLNMIMSSTSTGTWEMDLVSDSISFCQRTASLLAYPPKNGTLKIKELVKYVHPDDIRFAKEKLLRHIHNIYKQLNIDLRIKGADSSWKWMQVRGRVISRNGQKKPSLLTGTIHDISEEKKSEEIIRESEIRYRELFNSMNSGAVTLKKKMDNSSFIINDINKAGMKITGISAKKEIIGKSLAKVFEGTKNTSLAEALGKMSEKDNYAKIEPFLYKGRNFEFWADSYAYILPSGETVWGFSDISEQLKTLKALQRSEEKYSGILKSANDPIFIIDLKTLEILECNNQAWKTLRYPKHALIGKKYDEIVPDYRQKSVGDILRLLEEKGALNCLESVMIDAEGHDIHVELSGNIFEIDGRKAIICIARDISERRKIQELREDFEKLSRHDLKSPLNFIINAPEMIRDRTPGLSGDAKELLDMIENSSRKMLDTINLSIGLHRLEDGFCKLKREVIDLAHVMEDIYEEQQIALRVKSCRLTIKVEGKEGLKCGAITILAERLTFASMLGNLVKNAIEAAPEKTEISVSVSMKSGETEISIHNQGEVPDTVRDKFFGKYITSGKLFGTGLGTYYAKLIADAHKAAITMKTCKSSGTTVTLTMPKS